MPRQVSVSELERHNKDGDVWIAVNDQVFNFSNFEHPGGQEIILEYAGRDGSATYNAFHAPSLIGKTLSAEEHIGALDEATVPEGWRQQLMSNKPVNPGLRTNNGRPPLDSILNVYDFEKAAKATWSEKAWAYINGASNDNLTRDANQNIFRQIWLRPAVMRDVTTVNMRTELFGAKLAAPFYIAPTGAVKTANPEGELALTRAAGAKGTVLCMSTPSSFPHDEILDVTSQNAFFQLYVNKDRKKSEEAVRKVESTGKVRALFVTVDLPVISKREDDERVKMDAATSAAVSGLTPSSRDSKGSGFARQSSATFDAGLCWDDVAWLKSITKLPIVLKGVQRWEDAKIASQQGLQGIVLSNHGGRAADTAPPAIITLLELHKNCPEVFDSLEVLVDGGFRRGSDIVKAICLGASAVGLGRPFLYASSYGVAGVEHAIDVLQEEIKVAMQLCGLTDLMRDASPEFVNTGAVDALVREKKHPYASRVSRLKARL